MSLHLTIAVQCDSCRRYFRAPGGDRLAAEREAGRRGWIIHPWDSYGNVGHFCDAVCRDAGVERVRKVTTGSET